MLKKLKKFPMPTPPIINMTNHCSREKMDDVIGLVQKLGCEENEFYQNFKTLKPKPKGQKGKKSGVEFTNKDLF